MSNSTFIAGNYFDKYRSGNPIHQRLMRSFLADVQDLLNRAEPTSVIEAGCGPGDLACHLLSHAKGDPEYVGSDVCPKQIEAAREKLPHHKFVPASIYELPFQDGSADLVIACEVLEHLETPALAVQELARVTRKWAIVSVPWEPTWRILNIARGKYWASLGNTPGHLQNFSRRAIRSLLLEQFRIVAERRPLPWTVVLLEKR